MRGHARPQPQRPAVPAVPAQPQPQARNAPFMMAGGRISASAGPRFSAAGGGVLAGRSVPMANARPVMPTQPLFYGSPRMGQSAVVEDPQPQPMPQEVPTKRQERPDISEDRKSRRRAWGRLKKMEAEELGVYLRVVAARMRELRIPAGIVQKLSDQLNQFSVTAQPNAEFEMTDAQVIELDEALHSYEEIERQKTASTVGIAIIGVAATGALIAILV